MIISSIQIENFQCFYGKTEEIKLGRGCTVFHGKNGAGKSRLFNAFNWCFMNRYYETTFGWRKAQGAQALESLISNAAQTNHDSFTVSVEIRFELDDEEIGIDDLKLRRAFSVTPSGPSESTIHLSYSEGSNYQEYSEPTIVDAKLDSWFDYEIRGYMWFQGETLDELVQFERKDSLQELTKRISHYRHYEDLVSDGQALLKYSKRKLEAEQTAASKDKKLANGIESDLRTKRNEASALEDIIKSTRQNIRHCEESRLDAEAMIELTASSADFVIKAKDADRLLEKVGDELESLRTSHANNEKSGLLLGLKVENEETFFSKLHELEAKLTLKKKELGAVNQSISLEVPSQSDLEKLISAQRCEICGTDAPEGSDAYQNMVTRLEEMKEQSNAKNELRAINLIQREIPEIRDMLRRKIDASNKIFNQFKTNEELLEEKWVLARDKRTKAQSKLIGIPSEASNFEGHKRRKAKAIEDQKRHQKQLEKHLERQTILKNRISAKERELNELTETDAIDPSFLSKKELAAFTLTLLSVIRDQEKDKLLNDIESESNKLYADLLKGAIGVIATLKINRDDMSMELVDANGDEVPDPNSANWLAAKIALIMSILKLTKERLGKSYPMISDAATSDMDEANAKNYVRVTSKIFEQTIIISKDFSYDSVNQLSDGKTKFYTLKPLTLDGNPIKGQATSTKNLKVEIIPHL